MNEHDLEQRKKEAAAKARAAVLARRKEQAEQEEGQTAEEKEKALALAKAKTAAAAKAKAAALAKKQNQRQKAAPEENASSSSAKSGIEAKETLPNQDKLNQFAQCIEEHIGEGSIEEAYVNPLSKHVPTIVVKPEDYYETAKCLNEHKQLRFEYMSELHGTDFQTHLEVYVHFYSYTYQHSIALKVKLDRNSPILPSLTPLWAGANWPECEAYDLLGIQFANHPDLKRILLGEDWVGFPLRKDYEPYDAEV